MCFRDTRRLPIIQTMQSHFALGAAGWDWPDWTDAFYPSDMPEAWRLTYFNTQFECVFLAAPVWRQAGAVAHEIWAADTHEHFVFLLEDALAAELPPALAGRALGVARNDPRLIWFDSQTALKPLAQRLAAMEGEAPVYLVSGDGNLGQIERVRTLLELMGL